MNFQADHPHRNADRTVHPTAGAPLVQIPGTLCIGIDTVQTTPRISGLLRSHMLEDLAADGRARHPNCAGPPFQPARDRTLVTACADHSVSDAGCSALHEHTGRADAEARYQLCVIDTTPRRFTVEDVVLLEDLASLVVDELELRLDPAPGPREVERRERADRHMHATRRGTRRPRPFRNATPPGRRRGALPFPLRERPLRHLPDPATATRNGLLDANPAFAALLGYPCPRSLLDDLRGHGRRVRPPRPPRENSRTSRLATEGIL